MKKMAFLLAFAILATACGAVLNSSYRAGNLSNFIIGKWQGEFQQTTNENGINSTVEYKLLFLPLNIMFFDKVSSNSELHSLLFHYEFIDENQIRVEGRVIDEISVARDGEYIIIDSSNNLIHDGRYARLPIVDRWGAITITIGVLSLLTLFVQPIRTQTRTQELETIKKELKLNRVARFFTHSAMIIVMLGLGVLIMREVLIWMQQLIEIPWDSAIMIELGVAISVLGLKDIRAYPTKPEARYLSITRWLHHFGVFLFGGGVWGIGISILKLVILFNFGSYSPF